MGLNPAEDLDPYLYVASLGCLELLFSIIQVVIQSFYDSVLAVDGALMRLGQDLNLLPQELCLGLHCIQDRNQISSWMCSLLWLCLHSCKAVTP